MASACLYFWFCCDLFAVLYIVGVGGMSSSHSEGGSDEVKPSKVVENEEPNDLEKEEEDKKLEQALFLRIVNAFMSYKKKVSVARMVRLQNFQKLQNKHRLLLSIDINKVFSTYQECIDQNAKFCEDICESSYELFSNFWPNVNPYEVEKNPPTEMDLNKVFSTLRQFMREWSSEGKTERDCVYQPILQTLEKCFPNRSARSSVRVLIPGAGLCRLSAELALRGFFAEANEVSYHMLIAASYIQNKVEWSGQYRIYPYCDVTCNLFDRSDQFAEVLIPDMCIYEAIAELEEKNLHYGELSMVAGEFTEVYSKLRYKKKYSAIATCFFIDTAQNIIEYLEIIYEILQPGGYWVNVGPLLYHFADSLDSMSIELSLKEVLDVAEHIGFQIFQLPRIIDTTYTTNQRSMKQLVYRCAFFVLQRPSEAINATGSLSPTWSHQFK